MLLEAEPTCLAAVEMAVEVFYGDFPVCVLVCVHSRCGIWRGGYEDLGASLILVGGSRNDSWKNLMIRTHRDSK